MTSLAQAKDQLDKVLRKSRVHFYKPIQVSEILHRHRTKISKFSLDELSFYRTRSKAWRDEVSRRLVGRISTSSARFQDNLFEPNACPPTVIEQLGKFNEKKGGEGTVEAYIYLKMADKLKNIVEARNFLAAKGTHVDIEDFIGLFERKPGLKRSVDKAYEICVYALFSAIVRLLKVELTMRYDASNKEAIADFKEFISSVLGINGSEGEIQFSAQLHRVGVTNAADRGLDMFTNFGIAVQIKHMSLTEELAEDITDSVTADDIVIVCKDAEEKTIKNILAQAGMRQRIRGIITFEDLKRWFEIILVDRKYGEETAKELTESLLQSFEEEFPATDQIELFMKEREYDRISMPKGWEI